MEAEGSSASPSSRCTRRTNAARAPSLTRDRRGDEEAYRFRCSGSRQYTHPPLEAGVDARPCAHTSRALSCGPVSAHRETINHRLRSGRIGRRRHVLVCALASARRHVALAQLSARAVEASVLRGVACTQVHRYRCRTGTGRITRERDAHDPIISPEHTARTLRHARHTRYRCVASQPSRAGAHRQLVVPL